MTVVLRRAGPHGKDAPCFGRVFGRIKDNPFFRLHSARMYLTLDGEMDLAAVRECAPCGWVGFQEPMGGDP